MSWVNPPNDDFEPSTQELTQRDDGPQLELYGSFGMHLIHVGDIAKVDDGQTARSSV
jgi:SWI/SNF-related matrix-associated actin-dependent regulator of chromatin subfamily A3